MRSAWVVGEALLLVSGCASSTVASKAPSQRAAASSAGAASSPTVAVSLLPTPFEPPASTVIAPDTSRRSPTTIGTLAGTSPAPTAPSVTSASALPAPIREAVVYLQGRTHVPLLVPTLLPNVIRSSVLSAQASATPSRYEVRLYTCPTPLPLNDPGIGNAASGQDCSAMADMYGDFTGQQEPSGAAAQAAVQTLSTNTPTKPACATGTPATLNVGGTPVTTLACPQDDLLYASWSQLGWSVVMQFGFETTETVTLDDADRAIVTAIVAALRDHVPPTGSGVLEVSADLS
jgi:hypothetical protein